MKFGKELEHELVPEWRIKYLNYKAGKKHAKAVARAINKASGTPGAGPKKGDLSRTGTFELPPAAPTLGVGHVSAQAQGDSHEHGGDVESQPRRSPEQKKETTTPPNRVSKTGPRHIRRRTEGDSLTKAPDSEARYGSFVLSSPEEHPLEPSLTRNDFELPNPAISIHDATSIRGSPSTPSQIPPLASESAPKSSIRLPPQRSETLAPPPPHQTSPSRPKLVSTDSSPARLRRLLSHGQGLARKQSNKLTHTNSVDLVRQKEMDFFKFMDNELDKVETFYKQKEEQAGVRLNVLRQQLHEMRNRRAVQLAEQRQRQHEAEASDSSNNKSDQDQGSDSWAGLIRRKIFRPGPNSKGFLNMPKTPTFRPQEEGRDYVKKPQDYDVPYRSAKRKLKLALQEFYRGLELLKSYTMLNRTAFRKLNKKYDKAVNSRQPLRYMAEKVNRAWFPNSDVIDGYIVIVEDLYARYFERGNHKAASTKLRRLIRRPGDRSGNMFVNGLLIGVGAVFTCQALTYAIELLYDQDPLVRVQTSYVLQLYGGYFLMLYLFSLFCVDCYIWTTNKINYPFIFEFDTRHSLDWRQLSGFPSFCLFLLGIISWVNFSRLGSPVMYIYYPVILIFVTLLMIFFPARILAYRSRKWFAFSHGRLFLAGVNPVEFRDFFLGDIYCSLTYSACNIELFFCLYAHFWDNPSQCNSSHSRLLGFFSALPPIWRALQCIRRYADTRNIFPHLVNCGKYTMTIMAAVSLSLYRIQGSKSNLALFITFSVVNSIYCSFWDLFMDFSLLQPDAKRPFLRDILALKRRWLYYGIMVLDPILRFSWILYAIFTFDAQHSTAVSFLVGLAEATRRGMWTLFRVENEHCANVSQYKASRDLPLPYHLDHEPLVQCASLDNNRNGASSNEPVASGAIPAGTAPSATSADRRVKSPPVDPVEATGLFEREPHLTAVSTASRSQTLDEAGLRRRARGRAETFSTTGGTIRRIMAEAHKEDFVKKKRTVSKGEEARDRNIPDVEDDEVLISDEDDDDDDSDSGSTHERNGERKRR